MDSSGHTVLVTGGAAGIGRALARAFVRAGSRAIIADSDREALRDAAASEPALVTHVCDVRSAEQLQQLVHFLRQEHPGLNVLINNAGIHINYLFTDASGRLDDIQREIDTNLVAPARLCALLLPQLLRQPRAAIINVTSGLAFASKKNAAIYCATKAGLHMFTRTLRRQLQGTSVRVFELLPPLVDTRLTWGRGTNKMQPEELAARFLQGLAEDREEMNVGDVGLLRLLHRLSPTLADARIEED